MRAFIYEYFITIDALNNWLFRPLYIGFGLATYVCAEYNSFQVQASCIPLNIHVLKTNKI